MPHIELFYNEDIDLWRVFVDYEWYFVGTWEQVVDVINHLRNGEDYYETAI